MLTVDRDAIENSGYNNLQQLLEKLPVNGNGAFSTRGNNQDSTANGAASISLRGLGADATLVLVNGRRVAISSFAESVTTNFVDINSIPVAAIERVEVLKDGASAVYGSDAVAGVVNIVLRQDFDGVEVSAGYGDVTSGSAAETTASAIWGTGERRLERHDDLRLLQERHAVQHRARPPRLRQQVGARRRDYRSSRGFPGRFFVEHRPSTITIDPACPADRSCRPDLPLRLRPVEPADSGVRAHRPDADGPQGPRRRNVEVFTEFAVQHNTSIAQGAPTPLDETAGLTLNNHPDDPFRRPRQSASAATARSTPARASGTSRPTTCAASSACAARSWTTGTGKSRRSARAANRRRPATARMGWVRTDFLQTAAGRSATTTRSAALQPAVDVIDAITTSLVRQGKSEPDDVRRADHRPAVRHAGRQGR